MYKTGGPELTQKLHQMFLFIWQQETVPQDYKDATIIHLYERKGNRQVCDNHRGISLMSIAGKILARILLNRLVEYLEDDLLSESQCGFRKERGTVDMVFAPRQLQEKCQEQNVDLYSTYVDLTKAFDTVSRDGLWRIMAKYGCPDKFITIVRQLHDGMLARVQENGEASEPFQVTNGVKQACVLAPTLFSLMFSAMLTHAFKDQDLGINMRYRYDRSLYRNSKQKPWSLMPLSTISYSLTIVQELVDIFSAACDKFGLTISTKKTEISTSTLHRPCITINEQKLNAVEKFTYLSSTLSRNTTIDDEVDTRLAKASAAVGRLNNNV